MRMHGVVFLGDRELELRAFPDPQPGPREVIVAMKASGLCGSYLVYGSTAHGGHAPLMRVGPGMLVPLADGLTFEEGAAIACGTGTAYLALKRLDVSGRDTLAVFGQGPVGVGATLLARPVGARLITVDGAPERLTLARDFGADEVVDASQADPVEAIRDLTHGEGAEATLDCTGNPTARANAVKSARAWGRTCFV